jgi:hypothetical protein
MKLIHGVQLQVKVVGPTVYGQYANHRTSQNHVGLQLRELINYCVKKED